MPVNILLCCDSRFTSSGTVALSCATQTEAAESQCVTSLESCCSDTLPSTGLACTLQRLKPPPPSPTQSHFCPDLCTEKTGNMRSCFVFPCGRLQWRWPLKCFLTELSGSELPESRPDIQHCRQASVTDVSSGFIDASPLLPLFSTHTHTLCWFHSTECRPCECV